MVMNKRILAAIVAASMILSVAGCSKAKKVTVDSFVKAAEALDCEEVDLDDFNDAQDDIEDGIYCVADADDIEDSVEDIEYSLESYDLDGIVDAETIESMAILAKGTGIDELEDINDADDLEDYSADIAFAVCIEFNEDIDVEDVMDALVDGLDEYDIDAEGLPSTEYYSSATAGYFRENIDVEDLVAAVVENDDIVEMLGEDEDDVIEALEALSGQVCITTEVTKTSITVAFGAGINNDASILSSVCSRLGLKNVTKIKSNTELIETIVETAIENYASLAYSSYDY